MDQQPTGVLLPLCHDAVKLYRLYRLQPAGTMLIGSLSQ